MMDEEKQIKLNNLFDKIVCLLGDDKETWVYVHTALSDCYHDKFLDGFIPSIYIEEDWS